LSVAIPPNPSERLRTCLAPSLYNATGMAPIFQLLRRLARDERGVAMVEYLEILLLVVIGAAVAMAPLGMYLMRYYDNVEFLSGLPFP
jgi:Flp pilus assembly pilin Flp